MIKYISSNLAHLWLKYFLFLKIFMNFQLKKIECTLLNIVYLQRTYLESEFIFPYIIVLNRNNSTNNSQQKYELPYNLKPVWNKKKKTKKNVNF